MKLIRIREEVNEQISAITRYKEYGYDLMELIYLSQLQMLKKLFNSYTLDT